MFEWRPYIAECVYPAQWRRLSGRDRRISGSVDISTPDDPDQMIEVATAMKAFLQKKEAANRGGLNPVNGKLFLWIE
jgi:hypothetical protein